MICGLIEDVKQTASGSDAGHRHKQECYVLDCPHERGEHKVNDAEGGIEDGPGRDDACGYIEAVPETPCGYVCNECGRDLDKDSGAAGTTGTITVTAFDELDEAVKYQTVPAGTMLDDLTLPAMLDASGYVAADDTEPIPDLITITGVTWEPDSPWDETAEQGSYLFTPVLPAGFALADGAALPEIAVRIGGAAGYRSLNSQETGDLDGNGYHDGDETAFRAILDANLSLASGDVDADDPATWGTAGVIWDGGRPQRIFMLSLVNRSLTGMLDVSKFGKLGILLCSENPSLTELTLGANPTISMLQCYGTGIKALDTTGCPNLQELWCADNPELTQIMLGEKNDLSFFTCAASGISGELDISGCTNLDTFWCSNNPGLTTLTMEANDKLRNFACFNTGISGTLDMTGYTALEILDCSNNPGLTGLNLVAHNGMTDLNCNNNPYTSFTVDGHTLTVTPTANGKVWLTDFDLSNSMVTLTAKPDSGYDFQAWTGLPSGASGDQTTNFILDSNITVAATFASTDATLKTLSLSSGTLNPAFAPAADSYTASVDNSISSVTITAEANNAKAAVSGDIGVKPLNVGENFFTVTVTAENGAMKSYTVTITRAASADATLKSLSLSSGILTPTFDPAADSYTALVDNSISSVTIAAEANDAKAAVSGDIGVKLLNVGENSFTVTVTAENGTIKRYTVTITRAAAASGGSGDDEDDSNDYAVTTLQPPKPNNPVLAVIELPVTVVDGTANGKPDDVRTASAIAEAGRDSKANTNGIAIQFDMKIATAYDGFSITIQRATFNRLLDAKVKVVTLNTGIVDLTFDFAALGEIQKQTTGDIILTATKENGLTGDALATVGTRPAYRLTVNYTGKDGKPADVHNFGAGRITVGFSYKPAETERIGSLCLIYSADGKGVQWLYQSSYDSTSRNVIASTDHLSVYGVGYKPAPAFTDTENHWAKADIDFVASRGLLAGTSDTTFMPDVTVTRGMFVAALGRLAGIDPAAYPSNRFTDIVATAWYAPYVEWAASEGIVTGTGEMTFSPDATITREQMAAMMQRYAETMGYSLPVVREAETFADEGQITSSMKNAVQTMQQAGVMNSKGDHRFGPRDAATRAEAAAVLRRFVEIVIDPATAGGWEQNDAGKWLYYENNKPVTGWKQIDGTWYYFDAAGLIQAGGWYKIGGKWYYFFPDGAMAVNTKIDSYEIGPDGAWKE